MAGMTYECQCAVVDEELLDLQPPVGPQRQVPLARGRLAYVAAPGVDVLQLVEGPLAHQDVDAVLAETSEE